MFIGLNAILSFKHQYTIKTANKLCLKDHLKKQKSSLSNNYDRNPTNKYSPSVILIDTQDNL